MPDEENAFWTEIFQRELRDSDDPAAMMAEGGRPPASGVLLFRGWGLESRVGAEQQAQLNAVQADVAEARKKLQPGYPFLHGVQDAEKPVDLPVALRGNPNNLGPEVSRHFLSVLSKGEPEPFKKGSGRLELAEDILAQPLAMRVIVNRIWKGHFGTGIIDTPSNFGVTGERPTNPELLEYLANSFVKGGSSFPGNDTKVALHGIQQLRRSLDVARRAHADDTSVLASPVVLFKPSDASLDTFQGVEFTVEERRFSAARARPGPPERRGARAP